MRNFKLVYEYNGKRMVRIVVARDIFVAQNKLILEYGAKLIEILEASPVC